MLRLYIVRHGQTQFNIEKKIQGWCDSPLTVQGITQAKNIGKNLDVDFSACYCSDSPRAHDTAQYIIQNKAVPIHITSKLREMHFGQYEKISFDEYHALGEDALIKGFVHVGGEDLTILSKRLMEAIEEIRNSFADGNILVVSHGRAIMTLLNSIDSRIENVSSAKGKGKIIENCSVSIIEYDNKWIIKELNNTSYRE